MTIANVNEQAASGALVAVVASEGPLVAVLRAALHDRGYRTLALDSTHDADRVIARERPALILLDIHVEQHRAGIALLRLLRANPITADCPVLVWSADVRALHAKAPELTALRACVMEAPFHLATLYARVTSLLD